MKSLSKLACLLAVGGLALWYCQPATPAPGEKAATALFKSLTAEQKKLAVFPFDSKEKYKEIFPGVKREGLPFTQLSDAQKQLVNDAIRAVTSDYGTKRILDLAKQTPNARRYLSFFGDPTQGKEFAWRMAQHHLTLIYAEFNRKNPGEFGPILLGGNPVKTLWDEEDQIFLKLYASLSPEERKAVGAKGKKGKGIVIGNLNPKAKKLAGALLAKRAAVFAPHYRNNFDLQVKEEGGVEKLRLSIKGDGSKTHHKGGRYTWAISGESVLCDWQTRGNEHIHMTLRARP